MKYLMWMMLLLGQSGFAAGASKPPDLGTYSAFTEADWTVAFELKNAGKAVVTIESSYDYDKKGKRREHSKTVIGSWEYNDPHLILSFGEFKDRFIQDRNCYERRPCFKYDAPVESKATKSPLNVKYEFINWDK